MTQEVQAAARGYRGAARLYAGQKGHRAWGTSRPLPRVRRRHVFIFARWVKWYEICVQTTAFFLFHKKPFFFFFSFLIIFFFLLRKHMLCPDGLEMNVLLPGPSHFLSRFLSRSSQPPDEAAQRGRAGEGLPATWPPSPRLRPAPPAPTGRVGPHCVIRAPRVSGSSDKSSSPAFAHLEAVRPPPSYFVRRYRLCYLLLSEYFSLNGLFLKNNVLKNKAVSY